MVSCILYEVLLKQVQDCAQGYALRIYSNRSKYNYKEECHMCFLPFKVFFDPNSMEIILYLKDVENNFLHHHGYDKVACNACAYGKRQRYDTQVV